MIPFVSGVLSIIYGANFADFQDAVFFITITSRVALVEFIEDVKNIVGYQMLVERFRQIRHGIAIDTSHGNVSEGRIKKWTTLIQMARDQTRILAESQKSRELFFVLRCIVFVTLFLFILLNLPYNVHPVVFVFHIVWGIFSFMQLARLLLKTWMAETITSEESKIEKDIICIDTSRWDSSSSLQLKAAHDLIAQNPTQISYGYVTFNKGVLKSVFNQVVTYLIVIMQLVEK
ncbi:unnamed protein product [Allacma fusca]|uniref:Gustatory receptor n=1 Tax=Allacma fusca TaxID=39272 RepID=A0A8J2JTG1_9HEXA|nr:unnamed protein product [Allacma fusca]